MRSHHEQRASREQGVPSLPKPRDLFCCSINPEAKISSPGQLCAQALVHKGLCTRKNAPMHTKAAFVHQKVASSNSVPVSSPADSPRLLAAQFFAQGDPRQAGHEASLCPSHVPSMSRLCPSSYVPPTCRPVSLLCASYDPHVSLLCPGSSSRREIRGKRGMRASCPAWRGRVVSSDLG